MIKHRKVKMTNAQPHQNLGFLLHTCHVAQGNGPSPVNVINKIKGTEREYNRANIFSVRIKPMDDGN